MITTKESIMASIIKFDYRLSKIIDCYRKQIQNFGEIEWWMVDDELCPVEKMFLFDIY